MRRALALVAERPRDLFELLYRAADREAAKQQLIERWQVSDAQAEAMLAARLSVLTEAGRAQAADRATRLGQVVRQLEGR